MRAFDVDFEPSILEQIAAHAEHDYPIEACGIGLGRAGDPHLARVVPLRNVQDRYHALDPDAFPRDGRDAFRIDELERMRMLEAVEAEGLIERVLYHSHCDAGAYFSPEDRAMAVVQGIELMPNVVHVVVSVRNGRRADLAAFRFNAATHRFDEVRLTVGRSDLVGRRELADGDGRADPAAGRLLDLELPSLELRAMEGREAARPIRPFGGHLMARRVTSAEKERLLQLAEKGQIRIDREESIRDLRCFELGLYSPLAGFLRSVETRSIEQSGRLLSGTPWRSPVVLEIAVKKSVPLLATGSLVELVDRDGAPLAAMGLVEVARGVKDAVRLAGPVYVFDSGAGPDAADSRAELLRRGAKSVLAVRPTSTATDAEALEAVKGIFDQIIHPPFGGRDLWLDAVIAQNLGATHIWIEDAGFARVIQDTLAIVPWRPGQPAVLAPTPDAR